MKRFLLVIFIMLAFVASSYAAESVSVYQIELSGSTKKVVFDVTAAADGSVTDTSSQWDTTSNARIETSGWVLVAVYAVPGGTGPTADSDVYIKDAEGIDVLDGQGENILDNSITVAGTHFAYADPLPTLLAGPVTMDVDNNSVNSATYKIVLYLMKY